MRFVITLFVPATEKRAVKRVFCDVCLTWIDIIASPISAFAIGLASTLATFSSMVTILPAME